MAGGILKRLLIVLVIAVPLVVVAGVAYYYIEDQRIEREALATPQVPEEAASYESAELAGALPEELNPATVDILRDREDVVLVDVRGPEEVRSGAIPDALHIPMPELSDRAAELPSDAAVVFICNSGRRSAEAVALAEEAGLQQVHHMSGGMFAWSRAGREMEAY